MIFIAAAVLWRVSRQRFLEFRAMVLTLSMAAFLTYAFVPAAPPWMASDDGLIGPVYRVTGSVWAELGVHRGGDLGQGGLLYNPVAASLTSRRVPDAAASLLLALRRLDAHPRCSYVLAMGWTLVYGGEHLRLRHLPRLGIRRRRLLRRRWVRARLNAIPVADQALRALS